MNIVVAVNSDWGIGYNNSQSLVISEDRENFRKITSGGIVIVGRKTFQEIGRPLPNRMNIILTQDKTFKASGTIVTHSIDEVLAKIGDSDTDKVFVIGGGAIYRQFLPMCSHAHVTKIYAAPPSDTFFPNLDDLPNWSLEIQGERHESKSLQFAFNLYKNNAYLRELRYV